MFISGSRKFLTSKALSSQAFRLAVALFLTFFFVACGGGRDGLNPGGGIKARLSFVDSVSGAPVTNLLVSHDPTGIVAETDQNGIALLEDIAEPFAFTAIAANGKADTFDLNTIPEDNQIIATLVVEDKNDQFSITQVADSSLNQKEQKATDPINKDYTPVVINDDQSKKDKKPKNDNTPEISDDIDLGTEDDFNPETEALNVSLNTMVLTEEARDPNNPDLVSVKLEVITESGQNVAKVTDQNSTGKSHFSFQVPKNEVRTAQVRIEISTKFGVQVVRARLFFVLEHLEQGSNLGFLRFLVNDKEEIRTDFQSDKRAFDPNAVSKDLSDTDSKLDTSGKLNDTITVIDASDELDDESSSDLTKVGSSKDDSDVLEQEVIEVDSKGFISVKNPATR